MQVRRNQKWHILLLALKYLRKSAELGYPKARKILKKLESGE
jgi:hypothetical protein